MTVEELMAREGGGSLTHRERGALDRAVAGDPELSNLLAGFRQIDAIVSQLPPPPTGWDALGRRVTKEIRRAGRMVAVLIGVAGAQLIAAVVAFVLLHDRFPIHTGLGLGLAIFDLPVLGIVAWLVSQQRRRLRDATHDWLALRHEWTQRLDATIRISRSMKLVWACFLLSTLIWILQVVNPDRSPAMITLTALTAAAALFWVWAVKRDVRRARGEREALNELFKAEE